MKKWFVALVLISVVAFGAGALAYLRAGWWLTSRDAAQFSVWGLDVSHHQGEIDWAAVARTPRVQFVYIKATEGGDWTDPRFAENWRRARDAGLRLGAYHFFTLCRPAIEQATHFLSVIPQEGRALPPAVDLEFGGNCSARPDRDHVRAELETFLRAVERASSRKPIVYVTPEAYDAYLAGSELAYPLWFRDLWSRPDLDGGHSWSFWQFHNRGRVEGISAPVDLNVYRGTAEELDAL